ncbi:hypothetical protein SAMN05444405_10246 [Bacteroides luti]|uniref:Lipoprotein n=1 Tax=Bacteroides luti TaxID=1297750 RepID=A0A1M4UC82_9BACE|nr:hypothetical protein [Bacteroides luti]SHE54160.1 hypothetical protein SAMN05444405_10246 [Bacteroides luti]
MKSPLFKISLLQLLILITFSSCKPRTAEANIEKAISDLTNKFPQLPRGKSNQLDFYKLVRTVIYDKNKFQLQLYSTPDSIEDQQQIMILINPKGDYYAIPLFSNTYRDYWNFEFDKPIEGIKRINTTFEKEITKAINILNLNDTIDTGAKVLDETIISLLHCQVIRETDGPIFKALWPTYNSNEPIEDSDSCIARLQKNFTAIKKRIHPNEYYYNYNAYLDNRNCRIYQLVNQGKNRGKRLKPEIKTYRQNCNFSVCYK